MNVKELKDLLAKIPDNMDVRVSQTNTEFDSSECENGNIRNILFQSPDVPKKEWPTIKCFVLSDQF